MSTKITKPSGVSTPAELLRAICAPQVLPGENADSFAYLRQALFQDLDPNLPYEQLLAEQMVALEWDTVRYRTLRDNLLKAEFKTKSRLALNMTISTRQSDYSSELKLNEKQSRDLVSIDIDRRQIGLAALAEKDIDPAELMAQAYQNIAKDLEVFERQIAESETRRRRLREDYDRIRGSRPKQVEDAEVIEP